MNPEPLARVLDLVAEAGRSPSPHNTQPARWCFRSDGRIELWEDRNRRLTAGDPTGRDAGITLGAAFEGMAIALSQHGLALDPELAGPGANGPLRLIATTRPRPGAGIDPLAAAVTVRRTWRRPFLPARPADTSALEAASQANDLIRLTGDRQRRIVAEAFDRAVVEQLLLPGVIEELRQWIRFTPGDPAWSRDGLSAEAIGIGKMVRRFAPAVMSARGVGRLHRAGLLRHLVTEAAAIRSAAAIVILHRPVGENPFHLGRRFYRLWLQWTRAGFGACPMSALADHAPTVELLRREFGVPSGSAIVNVFRVGLLPPDDGKRSARLPAPELLLTDP